jgi:4-amino-4-deoxy-L-arabinose transferase-like glycosyltransferase
MKPRHCLFLLLAALTVARLVLAASYELSSDEAYYYLWSQHPDLSYFSKGPGVAFAIRASTALFGPTEFGVRFLSPLLALGTSLIVFHFARRLYNERVAIWTVLLLNALPIFNVGAIVMTIDPLSIFLWAASVYTFWLALEKSPAFSWWWPLTGLLIGLGFLAKYTNAMELLSILLLLAFTRRYRRDLLGPGFWSMLVIALACTIPVIVWNSQHAWITLVHLSARGGLNTGFAIRPRAFLQFLGKQCGVYSPLVFIGLIWSLWWAGQRAGTQFKPRFLGAFAVPLLVMYASLAIKSPGEPNWTAPAFVTLGILGVALWLEKIAERPILGRLAIAALLLALAMTTVALDTDILRVVGIPFPYAYDTSGQFHGWQTSADAVQQFRHEFEQEAGHPVFLIANKYQTASSLAFYMTDHRVEGPGHPPVYLPESQDIESEFSFWPRYDEFVTPPPGAAPADAYYTEEQGVNLFQGRDALFITDESRTGAERPPSPIQRGFDRVELVRLFRIERRGLPLRDLRIFACYNYRPLSVDVDPIRRPSLSLSHLNLHLNLNFSAPPAPSLKRPE